MDRKHLIAGLFLTFVLIILGCAQKEQKLTEKPAAANAEKPQQTPPNANESASIGKNQMLDKIDNTDALDSALGELDSIE